MGSNQWVDEHEWPIARTRYTEFYLHSSGRANTLYGDGKLSADKPQGEKSDLFTSDPQDPVPFITEPSFAQIGGPDDIVPSNGATMCSSTLAIPSPAPPR